MVSAADSPIFIVGPSRSGTTMLRGLLNQHSSVCITRETHFYDDLRPKLPTGPLPEKERVRCEDYLLRIGHRAYGLDSDPEQSRVPREDLRELAQQLGGTRDAYFEAFCRLTAREKGGVRWGEKTPRHVFRIDELLTAFPDGKVVCLVRDPRAVLASYRDWTTREPRRPELGSPKDKRRATRSYNVVLHSLLWKSTIRAALLAQEQHGIERVFLQPYEPLVADPEPSLRRLAQWLDIQYEPAMLDVPTLNSSYRSTEAGSGIRTEPVDRWRRKLSQTEIAIVQHVCGSTLVDVGYEREPVSVGVARLALAWATVPTAFVRATLANRHRLGRVGEYVRRRAVLALGRHS